MLLEPWTLACLLAVPARLRSGPLATDPQASVGGVVQRWEHSVAGTHIPALADYGDTDPVRELSFALVDGVRFTDDSIRGTAAADLSVTSFFGLFGGIWTAGTNNDRTVSFQNTTGAAEPFLLSQFSSTQMLVNFPNNGYATNIPIGAPYLLEVCIGASGERYITAYDSAGVFATQSFGDAFGTGNIGRLVAGAYDNAFVDVVDQTLGIVCATSVVPIAARRTELVVAARRLLGHPV